VNADPRFLPHRTPTGIAEARYQANAEARASRYPVVDGIPDPRATWRPTVDPQLMASIAKGAFDAHRAAIAPADTRARIAEILLAELDRLYPPADMLVLARYDFTVRRDQIVVFVARCHPGTETFTIPPRDLPKGARGTNYFRLTEHVERTEHPLVPQAAAPVLEALGMAWSSKDGDFDHARNWPVEFKRKHNRQPRWREIEEAFPRVGGWLASKRGNA
jgi:hypothetical protein